MPHITSSKQYRVVWIVLSLWLAFVVAVGHYDNLEQVGTLNWFLGVSSGLLFGIIYFKLNSILLSNITAAVGIIFVVVLAFHGESCSSEQPKSIIFSAFALGTWVTIVWKGIKNEAALRRALRNGN